MADAGEDRLNTMYWHCLLLNSTSWLLASVCTLMSTGYSWSSITNRLSEEHAANTNTLTRHTQLAKACPTMSCIHLVYRKLKLEALLCWIYCVAGYFKGKTCNRSLPCKPDSKLLLDYVAPHNVAPCLVHYMYVASLWVHYKPQQNIIIIIIIEHVLIS